MANEIKCSNGHVQPQGGSRFCIYCGVGLTHMPAQQAPQQYGQHPQAAPAVQQMPVNYQNPQPPPQPNYPQPPQPYYPQPPYTPAYVPVQQVSCYSCGGNAANLPDRTVICGECRALKPLVPGYQVDNSAFAWAADAKAMSVLRSITPLNLAAKAVSDKVGRRWIESTFNGVMLSEKQMPHIFGQAVRAARILGMPKMPSVYISGERAWDMLTFGTDHDSFVVIGSALAGNFQGVDMLFLLAREMGHCKAGHALWKTVIRFFLGEQGPAKGFMAGGILANILSPSALLGGAMEMPLLAWARQAEITADRAGLLAVGSEEVARRVLLPWTLKSSFIFKQININAWLEQQSVDDDSYGKLSELTTTSTPYIGPRLKLLTQFAASQEYKHSLSIISQTIKAGAPKPPAKQNDDPDVLRFKCATCGTAMRIPKKALAGKSELPVKCPDAKCNAITRLKKNAKAGSNKAPRLPKKEENLNYGD